MKSDCSKGWHCVLLPPDLSPEACIAILLRCAKTTKAHISVAEDGGFLLEILPSNDRESSVVDLLVQEVTADERIRKSIDQKVQPDVAHIVDSVLLAAHGKKS